MLVGASLVFSAAGVSGAAKDSRTAGAGTPSADSRAQAYPIRRVPVREHCPSARKAIGFYRARYNEHRAQMGLHGAVARVRYGCGATRRRALEWRTRAYGARQALVAWVRKQWAAPPEPFLSIARCEQRGSGLYGVQWDAYSETYEGAYGFLHSTWDSYAPDGYPSSANVATIRQQTDVAMILVQTFGGYSSWPACHIRLGLPG